MVFSNIAEKVGLILGAVFITASLIFVPQGFFEKRSLIAPPPHLEYFSFGFQSTIADNLWLRSIQDFDYCEKTVSLNVCSKNSWLYQMLDTVIRLSPDNLSAYAEGGLALSVILSDGDGATKIFDKGVRIFPNNFPLLYRAGLHAYFDEKNYAKAAHLYYQAARTQGVQGSWLYSLSTRLYSEAGQREAALRIYYQMKDEGLDEGILKRMREKLGIKDK